MSAMERLLRAHHRRTVVNELVRDPDPAPTHEYERDPRSGAGNCSVCGMAEPHRLHPHEFLAAASDPERCTCALPSDARCHDTTEQPDGAHDEGTSDAS